MKAILQRVTHAKVTIDGQVSGEIGTGFLVLLGVAPEDTQEEALYLARKIAGLRVFTDENDKMNLALADVGGRLLVVSQFTLYADCRKGKRPNFIKAAKGEQANELYEYFVSCCRGLGIETQTGAFGADMRYKPGSAVASARRGGTTSTIDDLNKYFQINQMPVVSSNYWNIVHGNTPEEVVKDEEGMQTMRLLGKNMAWLVKSIDAAKKQGIDIPCGEDKIKTNFIR